jgi:hypothetical protein
MRRTIPIVACAILTVCGCEVRNYEERMDEQQRRIEIFDEENRYIGNSWIDMPLVESDKKKGAKVPAWPFEVFLRLPKEVSTTPTSTVYESPARDLRIFRYACPTTTGYNFFVAAGLVPVREKGKDDKFRAHEFPADIFRDRVRGALLDYYRKEYRTNPTSDFFLVDRGKLQQITVEPKNDRGDPLPPIEYLAAASKDTFNQQRAKEKKVSVFRAYFHQYETKQVAILVQIPMFMEGSDEFEKALSWSLKTLDLSAPGIAAKRNALMSRRR